MNKEMNEHKIQNMIIGFGKAGKTLAFYLGKLGQRTVLVEQSPKMYGGTCINVGCIPSKNLSLNADRAKHQCADKQEYYQMSVAEKKQLVALLNKANHAKISGGENVEVVDGLAQFIDDHRVLVARGEDETIYEAERIFINTGAYSFVPKIDGLILSDRILTSESIMDLETLPKKLTIIGAGFIGLEFAKTYAQYGSEVTILDASETFMAREDEDVAEEVKKSLEALGVRFVLGAKTKKVAESEGGTIIFYEASGEGMKELRQDYILVSTGRRPNVEALQLGNAGIALGERGNIEVNEFLQTNKEHIFALGDVNGGPNFTYISLDDFRIVKRFLAGDRSYSTKKRNIIPTSVFLHPTLSKAGLSEREAREKGYEIKVFKLPTSMVPKAKVIGNQVGLYKAVVDARTNKILGATIFAEESHEVINIIATAMACNADYTLLCDQIFTHPTMAEALNDLFQ